MSAIEETLQRIQACADAFCIIDNDDNVLRYKNMTEDQAGLVASAISLVARRGAHAVRDMDPTDGLNFLRLRMRDMEVVAAPGPSFLIVAMQSWTPHEWTKAKKRT